jgi:hypothetical protein
MAASLAALLVASALLFGACASGGTRSPGAAGADETWRTAPLTDVLTGDQFRLADLRGKLVALETMAIWCITCREQQSQVVVALDDVASVDLVYISLDIDPNERAEDLAAYARREGFEWRFAVAPRDVARSLAATFGEQMLSPPSTPFVLIGRDGQIIEQHLGVRGARELAALFREHLS